MVCRLLPDGTALPVAKWLCLGLPQTSIQPPAVAAFTLPNLLCQARAEPTRLLHGCVWDCLQPPAVVAFTLPNLLCQATAQPTSLPPWLCLGLPLVQLWLRLHYQICCAKPEPSLPHGCVWDCLQPKASSCGCLYTTKFAVPSHSPAHQPSSMAVSGTASSPALAALTLPNFLCQARAEPSPWLCLGLPPT